MNIMKTISIVAFFLLGMIGVFRAFQQKEPATRIQWNEEECSYTSVVFIAGFDEDENTYYGNAKTYFEGRGFKVIDSLSSVEEIIYWINEQLPENTYLEEIHIVSHSNPWRGLSMTTRREGDRLTATTLGSALDQADFPSPEQRITSASKIIFHACGLGSNPRLMQELKRAFTSSEAPMMYASDMFSVFGGRYAPHYFAQPYYVFYPTAESPGPMTLSKELMIRYPDKTIDWFEAIKSRKETDVGEVYSYKFNIPLEWEFQFENSEEVPGLSNREDIMDWVSEDLEIVQLIQSLNIPLEKFRWRSKQRGQSLIIEGKTTVLCVLEPIMSEKDSSEYRIVSVEDSELYHAF